MTVLNQIFKKKVSFQLDMMSIFGKKSRGIENSRGVQCSGGQSPSRGRGASPPPLHGQASWSSDLFLVRQPVSGKTTGENTKMFSLETEKGQILSRGISESGRAQEGRGVIMLIWRDT